MMATVLLLAASSFIGRHLLRELSGQGHRVVPTSRQPGEFADGAICDLLCPDQVARLVEEHRPDWIVQCAGATRSRDPRELYALHVGAAESLLRAARDHAPGAVVTFFGSAAEYGAVAVEDLPVGEDHQADPRGFFGASKLAQTQLARAACHEWRLRGLVVRPANVIGPGLGGQYLAAALVGRMRDILAAGGEREIAVMNAAATRDFVDARDVSRALRLLLEEAPPEPGCAEVYNLSTGRETAVLDVARMLAEAAGGDIRVTAAGNGETRAARDRSAVDRSACDPQKVYAATGWQAKIPVAHSLADLWNAGSS